MTLYIFPQSASWIPINRAATVLAELTLSRLGDEGADVVHLENPVRQSWDSVRIALQESLTSIGYSIENSPLPLEEWIDLVEKAGSVPSNPAAKILDFLRNDFVELSTGGVCLDTSVAQSQSPTLASTTAISNADILQCVHYWQASKLL